MRLSGTTATFMVLEEETAHVGWCGDSRAVLGVFDAATGTYRAVDLTRDHKPTDEAEKARIEGLGGMVMKVSEDTEDTGIPARVFDRQRPHFGPGIAMSRSIGDTNATALGVVPEPDYKLSVAVLGLAGLSFLVSERRPPGSVIRGEVESLAGRGRPDAVRD